MLLIQCAKNRNHLGRLMVSKALIPFLSFESIPIWVREVILERIGQNLKDAQNDHNKTHGLLMIAY